MESKFQGRFEIRIDEKGRFLLPTSWRSSFRETSLIFTTGIFKGHSYLDVYSRSEWETLVERIRQMPELKPEVQAFKRFYISGGQTVECDSQGRWLLPRTLRAQAQLESDALLVGMGNKIEIWNLKSWDVVYREMAENFEKLLGEVSSTTSVMEVPEEPKKAKGKKK